MDTEALRKIDPFFFNFAFLTNGVRTDGRAFTTFRKPILSKNVISHCNGSASIRCGKSFIIAAVEAEINPEHYKSSRGSTNLTDKIIQQEFFFKGRIPQDTDVCKVLPKPVIFINTKFPSMHGFEIQDSLGPIVHPDSYLISNLSYLLNSPDTIDYNSLRIEGSETASWILYLSINYIEYDGNFLDLSLLVAQAALENTCLPDVDWDSSSNSWIIRPHIHTDLSSPNSQSSIASLNKPSSYSRSSSFNKSIIFFNRPMSITFVNISHTHWLVDPSKEEEEIGISISLQQIGNKYYIKKEGGHKIDIKEVECELHTIATHIFQELSISLNELKFLS